MRIVFEPDAQERLNVLVDNLLDNDLGPRIVAKVVAYCPRDTGKLSESVDHHLEDHNLYITATGDRERPEDRQNYATPVELGHYPHYAWGHNTGKAIAPRPFMRPALYQRYY
jgi:hypothetical protein